MSAEKLEVSSEIYSETDFKSTITIDGKRISQFSFVYPSSSSNDDDDDDNNNGDNLEKDKDGDFVIPRKQFGVINIEHLYSTDLTLVGLQVWRGALLLADFIFSKRKEFANKRICELGSGCGLTGIAAAIYTKSVLCTDIDVGGILKLIENNINRNKQLFNNTMISVMELNFKNTEWSKELQYEINKCDIILAADVIYDDDLTEAFIKTIEKLLSSESKKIIYIALEKRYVFTINELDNVAPCYEHFLQCLDRIRWIKKWQFESIPIDFPQYFQYDRVKELILLKINL